MDIYFQKEEFEQAAQYAENLLDGELLESGLWQQAQMIMAKTFFKKENYPQAKLYLDTLSELNTKYGAEAKYLLAKTYYLEGEHGQSDTMIYKLVDQVPSYPYWIAKGFILLADNFIANDDLYNAKITFQSVIDNADDQELISIAREKLEILQKSENIETPKKEPLEVEMGLDQVKDKSIFELDTIEIKEPKLKEEVLDED
jgi:outer membrane protein assembly factor BamD (BamD/ComL family)